MVGVAAIWLKIHAIKNAFVVPDIVIRQEFRRVKEVRSPKPVQRHEVSELRCTERQTRVLAVGPE